MERIAIRIALVIALLALGGEALADAPEFGGIAVFGGHTAGRAGALSDLLAVTSADSASAYVFLNGERIDGGAVAGAVRNGAMSRDKSSAVLLTQECGLYFITDGAVTAVDGNVRSYQLALDGGAVAYTTQDRALKVYSPQNGVELICEDFDDRWDDPDYKNYGRAYAISPDGVVVYAVRGALHYYAGGVYAEASGEQPLMLGILCANHGANIVYVNGADTIATSMYYVADRGELRKLPIPDINYEGSLSVDYADDGSALIECASLEGGGQACATYISTNGEPFAPLPFQDAIVFMNREQPIQKCDTLMPVESYAGCWVNSNFWDGHESFYYPAWLDENLNLRVPENVNEYFNSFVALEDDSLYVFRSDKKWVYLAGPDAAPAVVEGQPDDMPNLISHPGCRTLYFEKNGALYPVADGSTGKPFDYNSYGDTMLTPEALYCFRPQDGGIALVRRTPDGAQQVLVDSLDDRVIQDMDLENFAGQRYNTASI